MNNYVCYVGETVSPKPIDGTMQAQPQQGYPGPAGEPQGYPGNQ